MASIRFKLTPAFKQRISIFSQSFFTASAKSLTDESSERSTGGNHFKSAFGTSFWIALTASSAFSGERHASHTLAPARASSRAVEKPMPELAPVTTAVFPRRSGRSFAVHFLGMSPAIVAHDSLGKLKRAKSQHVMRVS